MIGVLRRYLRFSVIPVLIVTSLLQAEQWPHEGIFGRLQKPCSVEIVLRTVRHCVGGRPNGWLAPTIGPSGASRHEGVPRAHEGVMKELRWNA